MIFKKHRYKHYKEIVRCIKLYDDNGKRPIIFEEGKDYTAIFTNYEYDDGEIILSDIVSINNFCFSVGLTKSFYEFFVLLKEFREGKIDVIVF